MPVLSYVHQLFNVDQCQAYIHTLLYRVIVIVRQQFADSFAPCIT
jgi:hypothetical protein